jgi:acetyltransferase-like isoleucine patch superfamily enzyme
VVFLGVILGRPLRGFEQGVVARLRGLSPRNIQRVLRHYGARIGPGSRFGAPLLVHNAQRSFEKLTLGASCHVGRDCFLDLKERITLGSRVTLSMRVTILTHADCGDSSWKERGFPPSSAPVLVEDDVYIGAGATILAGVKIGKGALVGAAALVREDVPAGAKVAGVPARVLENRAQG